MRAATPDDRQQSRGEILGVLLFCGVVATLYAYTSLSLHARLETNSYDLGIFGQAVDSYAHLDWPASTIRQQANLLGDHFSPVLVLLVPLWWLHPEVTTLLVAQAVLVVTSFPAVWLYARRHLDVRRSAVTLLLYALFFGFQAMVGFDFHEVAFAVPLLAWGLELADRRRLLAATACVASLLLVKESFAPVLLMFGVCLLVRYRAWRLAGFCGGVAVVGYYVITELVMARLNPNGFLYWRLTYGHIGSSPSQALQELVRSPTLGPRMLLTPVDKLYTLGTTFFSFAYLPLLSSWGLLLLPMLAERLLDINERRWSTNFHYSAVLGPVLAMGFIDVVSRVEPAARVLLQEHWRSGGRRIVTAIPAILVLTLPLTTVSTWRSQPVVRELLHPARVTEHVRACRSMLKDVPTGVPVEAPGNLAVQLVPRNPVWLPQRSGGRATTILVDRVESDPVFRSLEDLDAYVAGWERRGYVRQGVYGECLRLVLPADRRPVVTSADPYAIGSNTDGSSLDPDAPARLRDHRPQKEELRQRPRPS